MDVGSKHHQPSDHAAKTSPGDPALEFRMAETQSLALHMEDCRFLGVNVDSGVLRHEVLWSD